MKNLTHTADITEGKATEAIFNACRGNEKREAKNGVTFCTTVFGHEAVLRDEFGIVVAIADVDEFDC